MEIPHLSYLHLITYHDVTCPNSCLQLITFHDVTYPNVICLVEEDM